VIAEDLGTVPDFVRASIARLRIPGYKVLRWERDWEAPGQPFREPARFPALSVATTGTHDTETVAEWWASATVEERLAFSSLPGLAGHSMDVEEGTFGERELRAILHLIYAANSDLIVLPVQDLFGWRDRINTPATVGNDNWTWHLPWPVDEWLARPEPLVTADHLRGLAAHHGRLRFRQGT
jgi:4-alpha-glucanotransferase